MPDDTLARLINDGSPCVDDMPAESERSERPGSIQFANDVDNVALPDEGLVQPQDGSNADDVPDEDDLSPRVDAMPAESQELPRTRKLRGVPSAVSAATTVLDTASEDDVFLPLKRMRSQSPESSVQSACAEVIDLSPL